jgi:hypothetical protein
MALRCTPCKTGKEGVYSGARVENIFCESGNKMLGFCFALRCFSSQQAKTGLTGSSCARISTPSSQERARRGPRACGARRNYYVRLTARLKSCPDTCLVGREGGRSIFESLPFAGAGKPTTSFREKMGHSGAIYFGCTLALALAATLRYPVGI